MSTFTAHTKILIICFLILEKLNFSTIGIFISTSFEGRTGLRICLNVHRICMFLASKPLKYTKVWTLESMIIQIQTLLFAAIKSMHFIVLEKLWWTHSESVKKPKNFCFDYCKEHWSFHWTWKNSAGSKPTDWTVPQSAF